MVFLFLFLFFCFLFSKLIFNWRIIALQYCVGFSKTSTWISHRYAQISFLLSLPPHPTPLGCFRAPIFHSLLLSFLSLCHVSYFVTIAGFLVLRSLLFTGWLSYYIFFQYIIFFIIFVCSVSIFFHPSCAYPVPFPFFFFLFYKLYYLLFIIIPTTHFLILLF